MFNRWLTLLSKEFWFQLYSLTGIVFMLLFLIVTGCLLWIVPGAYNIPDNGYADFSSFFAIAPVLMLFLIPALSMRALSEEKKLHTLLLLRSRPVTMNAIILSKIIAILGVVLLTLLPTVVYVVFIYYNGNPVGNIDLGAVAASYTGLLFLIIAFIAISVFSSGITKNQVVAMILGMTLCAFFYYGFDLLSLDQFGFLYHYKSIQRGLIVSSDLFYFLMVSSFFYFLTLKLTGENLHSKAILLSVVFCCFFLLLSLISEKSWDWTKDKRYSLHSVSKEVLKGLESPLFIDVYLTGNLNPGFKRLQESTLYLLDNFEKNSITSVNYDRVDPYKKGKDFMESMNSSGMNGIAVNERLMNGRLSQNILYPYALVQYGDESIVVPLLVNQPERSGEENLNLSIEMLEYQFIRAVELLSGKEERRIAFLEGHGELPEESITELLDLLSYEYSIDRGGLSGMPGELDNYDLTVIAGPHLAFSEMEKFVLDQYLMQGGRLLWFVNGAQLYSYEELIEKGETISLANDLNLNDFFFSYGLRINPVFLMDVQSLNIPVPVVAENGETEYVSRPWYYAPLLKSNHLSAITKGLSFVKTSFSSTISLVGEEDSYSNKELLLASSTQARTVPVPSMVTLEETERNPDANYFNESNLPVAVLLHPPFESAFKNRSDFFSRTDYPFRSESNSGKMIVVASEEIITNPLGYDLYSRTQFANQEFILNAVNYLTDSKGLSTLKNKTFRMQLLNKKMLQENKSKLLFYTVILPPLVLVFFFLMLFLYRKRKYERKVES
ncbi:MAG: gliding motility-associated ABC transporter substrate-binding protein GldG [Bacteroidales bacterium]|nr:gliding motility-associated ABC transporter substrate-binding protein GldG [Bacteroidales bacterium]